MGPYSFWVSPADLTENLPKQLILKMTRNTKVGESSICRRPQMSLTLPSPLSHYSKYISTSRSAFLMSFAPKLFFFLLNMLWSRHVKPSPAIGEKSERSEIRDIKVCTDWSFPESVKCTIYDPLYKDGWIKKNANQKHATQKSTKSTHGSTQSISISK